MSSASRPSAQRFSAGAPRFSVVVVTYNSRENIQVCLDALDRCSGRKEGSSSPRDHEIIVVDNDSRDATPDYLSGRKGITAILNKENRGFSQACNQGAARATGEFLIFLNPDTLVTPGWSETMARYFRDPAVGAVGPLSNYVAGLQRLDLHTPSPYREGARFPGATAVEQSESVARILKEANDGRGVTTRLLIGFCLMIRRDLYQAMGGMDEDLFLGNDDLDLSWRLRDKGLKLVVATDAFVFHEGQKSFQTEKKSHVDRLVQESTDALYAKLVRHYGGRDKVPSSMELWGMDWFAPSPALVRGEAESGKETPMGTEADMAATAKDTAADNRQGLAWKGVTALIFLGRTDASEASRLERTLSSLPAQGVDAILVNCTSWTASAEKAPAGLRRLDLGSACPPRQALELAASLAGERILFCAAGMGFTALFNHWLDKRADAPSAPMALPIRAEADGEASEARGLEGCAVLCGKAWFRDAVSAMPANGSSAECIAALASALSGSRPGPAGREDNPPWLLARPSDMPVEPRESWTPAPPAAAGPPSANPAAPAAESAPRRGKWDEAIRNYPESLGEAMRRADEIAFAGSVAEVLPVNGPFRVFDMKGDKVPFENQDLAIVRLTPDMVDALDRRLANLRRRGRALRRLLLVVNPAQALGRKAEEGTFLAPMDVTSEGARAALWLAGFAVTSEKPYHGVPPVPGATGNLEGWTLMEAVPREEEHRLHRKVSIVILGFNQVEYTKKCVESIRAHTRQAYELILVDNGSKDGTEEFFRSVPGAKVIRNAENQGVAKGWNQGMRLAEGDYILIFNNDTIVGPGWVENMVRLCESDPSIGMVGPRSNYIAGPQVVKNVPYSTEAGIQEFIGTWQAEHALSASEFGFIKGFCLLIPRAVFRKVGFFDERFGKGNFEDDDYCMRVRCHGWRTLIAHDSFIHHYGSVSFNQESVDWKALMVENQRKYQDKWSRGIAAVEDTVVADPRPASAFPEGAPAAVPIPRMASTPAPQGGKAPSLPGIEEARKAFEAGDIASSRRLFLDVQARHPEHPEPYCGLGVIAFHDGSHRDAGNLFLTCLEFDPAHEDAAANLLDLFETLEGETPLADLESLCGIFPANPVFAEALRKRGGSPTPLPDAGPAPLPEAAPLEPWRADIEASIARRDFAPALDALESRLKSGRDASVCFNYMGVIAHACGDQAFAAENFRSALRNGPAEADAVFNLADTLLATGRAEEALRVLEEPPALAEADAGIDLAASAEQIRHALEGDKPNPARLAASRDANHKAEALLRAGRPGEAAAMLETALREDASDFRALNNLALCEWYQGRADKAFDLFRDCLRIRPAWSDALVNAFDAALACRRTAEIRPLLEAALSRDPEHKEALRIRFHIEREGLALEACRSFDDLEADAGLLGKAEKAMQEGRRPEAINLFLEAMERRPQNPQALNGLGVIAFLEKRNADAYALFDAAVALHPMDQDILVNLWQAAQSLRKEGEVLPRLKDSLERNPAMHDVKAILENA